MHCLINQINPIHNYYEFSKRYDYEKNDERKSIMSYVAPAVKDKFETLSVELKNAILARNVEINTIHDLINVLDAIVKESEEEGDQ